MHEAIRLARLLTGLMPDEPEASGLLALLLLSHARRAARATRADLLRRLDRKPEAAAAYQAAIALSSNDTERAYLTGRLRTLS